MLQVPQLGSGSPGLKHTESGQRACLLNPSTLLPSHGNKHYTTLLPSITDDFVSIDLKIKHIGVLFLKNNFLFINQVSHQQQILHTPEICRPWEYLKINTEITVLKSDSKFGSYKYSHLKCSLTSKPADIIPIELNAIYFGGWAECGGHAKAGIGSPNPSFYRWRTEVERGFLRSHFRVSSHLRDFVMFPFIL